MTQEELLQRVVSDPRICGGRACIKGTRIEVTLILGSLAEGASAEDIIEAYPHLKPEDIKAALAYAAELSKEGVWKV